MSFGKEMGGDCLGLLRGDETQLGISALPAAVPLPLCYPLLLANIFVPCLLVRVTSSFPSRSPDLVADNSSANQRGWQRWMGGKAQGTDPSRAALPATSVRHSWVRLP